MKTIVVLGMRSGSSMVSRALHLSKEVHMGNNLFIGESDHQPRGHYENKKFLHFNGDLLRELKCEWDQFPTREFIKSIRYKYDNTIKKMITESMKDAEKKGYDSWGWKDPRTIILIDLYLPHLTDPKFICCYRDPIEVAESLNRRDGTPIARGLEIARNYNKRLHEFMGEWLELDRIYIPTEVNISFGERPEVEIKDNRSLKKFHVEFIDIKSERIIYETNILSNQWCASTNKEVKDWRIKITGIDNDFRYEKLSPNKGGDDNSDGD